jgi:N-methylhydantoinase A
VTVDASPSLWLSLGTVDPVLGVDVGGTFTDLVLLGEDGLRVAKVPSTPDDQAEGVLGGLRRMDVDVGSLGRFVHGTTVATNAILERRGARTILVTTEGFRDLLEIGRQNRPKLYDQFADRPPPLVPHELVVEAAERVAADATVLGELESPEAVADAVRRLGPESVAVCLLFSFLDPSHERAIAAALGGMEVSCSSDVLPVFREYERASTTALNAYVKPVMRRYLGNLAGRLREEGLGADVEVMRSGGGTFTAGLAATSPVHTLLSGPAAGAWGAAAVGAAAGYGDVIAFDMGGTSTDATLIEGGRPRTTAEGEIGGLPFGVSSTEVHTVGAGGGSIAWRDPGGALRVGPRSAGADPGPASYGRRGVEPTVTDAYLLTGLLGGEDRLGGSVELHPEPARRAVGALADELDLDGPTCASGILRVLQAQVAKALRVVSVERGRDPRRYALLAFGGAGPLQQGALARELGFETVIVPRHPGVLSAFGLLAAPIAVDLVRTRLADPRDVEPCELEAGWRELEEDAGRLLERQGIEAASMHRSADCRYRGQSFELAVTAPEGAADPAKLAEAFHRTHRERYGYAHADAPVDIVNLRVRAEGPPPRLATPEIRPGVGVEHARRGERALSMGEERTAAALYQMEALGAGDAFDGPAIVAGVDSTCLVLPGQRADVDPAGNLVIRER